MCSNNCTERIEKIFKECLQAMIESVFQSVHSQQSQRLQQITQQPCQDSDLSPMNAANALTPKLASMFGSVLAASINGKGRKRKRRRRRNHKRDPALTNDSGYAVYYCIQPLTCLYFPESRTHISWLK